MDSFSRAIGASYVAGSTPLSGKLQLADKTVFDCTVPEEQAFVAELVYKHAELQRALTQIKASQSVSAASASAAAAAAAAAAVPVVNRNGL